MNYEAIVALLAELFDQVRRLTQENESLRQALIELQPRNQSTQPVKGNLDVNP